MVKISELSLNFALIKKKAKHISSIQAHSRTVAITIKGWYEHDRRSMTIVIYLWHRDIYPEGEGISRCKPPHCSPGITIK